MHSSPSHSPQRRRWPHRSTTTPAPAPISTKPRSPRATSIPSSSASSSPSRSTKVDADVNAQPLILPGIQIPGKGRHDVLVIATEHNTVYAFDAYGSPITPLWQANLIRPGETAVTSWDNGCPVIEPEVGITSTPVIDPASGTIYVLTRSKNEHLLSSNEYHQYLHALDIATGAEKPGSPVNIRATVPGKGDGSSNGQLSFDPLRESARAALLLTNGVVYLSWASFCDHAPYHGWIIGYDARTLQQRAVFNTSPDADAGGIWASNTGPAADNAGNIFVATGQGHFDADPNIHDPAGHDYGDTILKLHLSGNTLAPADYFTPFNAVQLERYDTDLGSGGVTLLPDQPGPTRTSPSSVARPRSSTSSTATTSATSSPTTTATPSRLSRPPAASTARSPTGTTTSISFA